MAQSFPMPIDQFFGNIPIRTVSQDLGEAMEYNQTAGGEIVTADMGPRLWRTTFTLNPDYHAPLNRIRARLNMLRQANRSLIVTSSPIEYPDYDPDGSILGASTITIKSVAGNNRDITLTGFPVDYELRAGDMLSFTYGSNPVRYAMHQVVSDGVANVVGDMTVEVADFIRPGAMPGMGVVLKKPYYKAVVVPDSTESGEASNIISNGLSFSVIQTLR